MIDSTLPRPVIPGAGHTWILYPGACIPSAVKRVAGLTCLRGIHECPYREQRGVYPGTAGMETSQ